MPLTTTEPSTVAEIKDPRERLFQMLQRFDQDVARAKLVGEKDSQGKLWVETDQEVLDYHFPKGFGGSSYAIYKDVFVTPKDRSKLAQQEISKEQLQSGFTDPRVRIVGLT